MHKAFVAALLITLPSFVATPAAALTCANEKLKHVEVPKNKRKKTDKIIEAFFPYIDAIDINAVKIISSEIEYDTEVYDCTTEWKQTKVTCGPISLMTIGATKNIVTYRDQQQMAFLSPYQNAHPFTIAKVGRETFALASRYALHRRFHPFFYKSSDPNWISASNFDSIKECAGWRTLKSDPIFKSLIHVTGRYFSGDIVCIQNVECKENVSATTLSVGMSLVPLKYMPTFRNVAANNGDGHDWEEWKTILTKVNPIFTRPDVKSATFKITFESRMVAYDSFL